MQQFPRWKWRNKSVEAFLGWLRAHNQAGQAAGRRAGERGVGFYGLDEYSLHSSAEAIVKLLQQVDPAAAAKARARYHSFDR